MQCAKVSQICQNILTKVHICCKMLVMRYGAYLKIKKYLGDDTTKKTKVFLALVVVVALLATPMMTAAACPGMVLDDWNGWQMVPEHSVMVEHNDEASIDDVFDFIVEKGTKNLEEIGITEFEQTSEVIEDQILTTTEFVQRLSVEDCISGQQVSYYVSRTVTEATPVDSLFPGTVIEQTSIASRAVSGGVREVWRMCSAISVRATVRVEYSVTRVSQRQFVALTRVVASASRPADSRTRIRSAQVTLGQTGFAENQLIRTQAVTRNALVTGGINTTSGGSFATTPPTNWVRVGHDASSRGHFVGANFVVTMGNLNSTSSWRVEVNVQVS